MPTKLLITYEALTYNMPECGEFEFLGHKFISNPVTPEVEQLIVPEKDILKANFGLQSCCLPYNDGHVSFVTAKNKTPLVIHLDKIIEDDLFEKVSSLVRSKIDAMEEHLIFITNVHIFFPVVKINVKSSDGKIKRLYGYMNNRPMPYRIWTHVTEGIDLSRRLHFHIDETAFDEFRLHKNRTRYNRAFNYYIRAFHEYDHSSAFCLLCSAIDAITGCNSASYTKERLSKYSSVLFCTPLEIEKLNERMRYFYKIRSTFTHGKGNQITRQDEIELREYVRKFLLTYFLFWQEMNIKNEQQMLQKLDEIYDDHSLYVKYVPGAYAFMCFSDEHEKQPNGMMNISLQEKHDFLISKLKEACIKPQ